MRTIPLALACLSVVALISSCSLDDSAAVGTGGVGGIGGVGGGEPLKDEGCVDSPVRCDSRAILPAQEDEDCLVDKPPVLADACDGTETLAIPDRCTETGSAIDYRLTAVELDDDCNSGYDLDGCDGNSCRPGGRAPDDGANGVDNALAGLAGTVEAFGGDLGQVNQAYYDSLCMEVFDLRFIVDANPDENCATVIPVRDGVRGGPVRVNLSDDGCLSGDLGSLSISFDGIPRSLNNARVRLTLSEDGFANGRLGATIGRDVVSAIACEILESGACSAVSLVLDISEDLTRDPEAPCDALSLALRIGGVALSP